MTRRGGLGLLIAGAVLAGCTADPSSAPSPPTSPMPARPQSRRPSPLGGDPRPRPARRRRPRRTQPVADAPEEAEPDLGAGADREEVRRAGPAARAAGSAAPATYRRYLVTYRGDGRADLRRDERADGKGPVPGAGAQPRLHRPGHLRRRPGHGPGARLPGPTRLRRPAHRLSQPRRLQTTTRTSTTSSGCRYAVDTINAVKAVKSSNLPFLDKDRVGWMGRSMGGDVTLNALVRPARAGRRRGGLRLDQLTGRRQLAAVQPGGRGPGDEPTDRADLRTTRRQPEFWTAPLPGPTSAGSPSRC